MSASTATAPAGRPDTTEMVTIHNVFRRLFGDAPALVRGVPDGDAGRAAVLCGFLDELATGLHHHHTLEDELLWPLLLERIDGRRSVVLSAEEQHERVAQLLALTHSQAEAYRGTAGAAQRDALADTLAELDAAVREHMADEERDVLPLVERHISVAEWAAVGERARASIPRDRLLIQLGWILDGVPAAGRRAFLRALPLPARIAWTLVGRRAWRHERDAVYGR